MAEHNGANVPWWVTLIGTIGIPGFIALYVLGAVPGLPSPILGAIDKMDRVAVGVTADHKAISEALWRLNTAQERSLDVQRTTCLGVWKGNPDMQTYCDGRPAWAPRRDSSSP